MLPNEFYEPHLHVKDYHSNVFCKECGAEKKPVSVFVRPDGDVEMGRLECFICKFSPEEN